MPLSEFDPLVADWFRTRFAGVTDPQALGWPEIRAGRDVLISAPTGSGKTLAAFLICLDSLVKSARAGTLPDRTDVLYVSPLKALSNDVRKNLEIPLAEIGGFASAIRTAVRTGDTTAPERRSMLRKPPHVVVTTPESLYILLTTESGRKMLAGVRTVILDEVHAIAGNKRGSHLALTLARLDALAGKPQRIGLSATVKPIEEVARFIGPSTRIVNIGHRREMDLAVEAPKDELGAVASNEMWGEIYDRTARWIGEHRTTLVFVNTRRLAERVADHLSERLGEGAVLPHHGSLAKQLRLDAEAKLKAGELKAVVATASLELGIDIGTVDLVVQIGSPRSIAVALQRFGRSGHWVGAMPKGRLIPTTRDDLIECAAVVRSIRRGELDALEIPQDALDILGQQMVAEAACGEWSEDGMLALARGAYPYRNLETGDFNAMLKMLSEGVTTARGRSGTLLHHDGINRRIRARRGARLAAVTSGGAIPDNANYQVVAEPEGMAVGTVDEDFAIESLAGDVFLLGATSWRIRRVEPGRLRVEDAHGAPPSIPFWNGEAPGRTAELSRAVARIRELGDTPEFFERECGLDSSGAEQAARYLEAGRAGLGAMPTDRTVVAERFFDEAGGMQLVIHAPFGARINRAWGLALRKRFCRSFNFELQAAATDNGIVISLAEQHAFPLDIVFGFVRTETVDHVLTQALLAAPMFTARWRWNASRALVIPRFAGGRKVPPPIQRMRADDLLAGVFPDQAACAENLSGEPRIPDHPLVKETIANCLHEAMDLEGLRAVLDGIASGAIRTVAVDTAEPSPFSHEIINANPYAFLDDAPLEERRTRAVQLRRTLKPDDGAGVGALDAAAIAQVAAEAWPEARNADEVHDALLTLLVLPPVPEWETWFRELALARRAQALDGFWVASERMAMLEAGREDCATEIVRGWLEAIGPVTADELASRLHLTRPAVDMALARLEGEGQVLRGSFRPGASEIEWCNRRLLARIHRLTLGRLRNEIEPVSSADFFRFLCRWQHVAPGTQLHGADGLLQVIRQLQGYEIPGAVWESAVLPARVARYGPELLDALCLSGEVMWGRLSESAASTRVRPTRSAPLSLYLREDAGWLVRPAAFRERPFSHAAAEVLAALAKRGASFFAELTRTTGRLASEVEDALWELVAAGRVTADGFENLRALLDPKRRRGEGNGRASRPRHAAGRWTLLEAGAAEALPAKFARQLLIRWGVVFRDLVVREDLAPPWRDLLVELRRMEAKGEIRGGRFVAGYVGEQYALPEAVEALRASRKSAMTGDRFRLASGDPLNLTGTLIPGPRAHSLGVEPLLFSDGTFQPASAEAKAALR
jgi:ATP-dependent Lhr-like helicase